MVNAILVTGIVAAVAALILLQVFQIYGVIYNASNTQIFGANGIAIIGNLPFLVVSAFMLGVLVAIFIPILRELSGF